MDEIEIVQLKAKVPQALKRQTFSLLALRGLKFSTWVRTQMEDLVADQHADKARRDAQAAERQRLQLVLMASDENTEEGPAGG